MKKLSESELAEIIRNAGFRATTPRVSILSFLTGAKYPLTIQEIIYGVGEKNIDQVTAYRTLEAFKKAGIVTQVDFQHGHAHYEFKDRAHDHHHVVCVSCEKVEDFVGCNYENLANKALKQTHGFAKIMDHSLEFFGLCNSCIKKNNAVTV